MTESGNGEGAGVPGGSATSDAVEHVTSSPLSLSRAVYARRKEYTRPHRVRVKVGTWNVAACLGTDKDLASWFVEGKGIDPRFLGGGASGMRVAASGSARRSTGRDRNGPLGKAVNTAYHDSRELSDKAELDKSNFKVVEVEDGDETEGEEDKDGNEGDGNPRLVGGDNIGLYVLGLQEVVGLNVASEYVSRIYVETAANKNKWTDALEAALPEGYVRVVAEQLFGTLLLVYASPEVAPTISNVTTSPVSTGLLGWFGNKGAISVRIVLGETTRLVFTNCHLASGNDPAYLDRRIADVGQIQAQTQFQPVVYSGVVEDEPNKLGDEDFAFWFGDLNFRLDGLPGDDIRRLLMLHTRGEYDMGRAGAGGNSASLDGEGEGVVVTKGSDTTDDDSSTMQSSDETVDDSSLDLPDPDDFLPDPHDDPLSLQSTLDSLLSHDQLHRMMKQRKAFHDGWREGPITFLPSYKYDVGTIGLLDSSEKQRPPSWCDRILFRTRRDKQAFDKKLVEEEEAKKKDEDMKARGIDEAGDEESVLFDYDPEAEAIEEPRSPSSLPGYDEYDEYADDEVEGNDEDAVITRDGYLDRLHLDIYTSHQRIISSDHKPVVALFTLDYDAVVPELKAKIHAEVARELDRAENESRPGITIVAESIDDDYTRSTKPQTSSAAHASGESDAVDFGAVKYLTPKSTLLTIANTGRVPATFCFVDKPTTEAADSYSLYRWLTAKFVPAGSAPESSDEEEEVIPVAGAGADTKHKAAVVDKEKEKEIDLGREVTLDPGETVCARLKVLVDDATHVRALNDGHTFLEEVLVIRVQDGRDHFVPVRGRWLPTCFGRSIEELIRVPDSVGGVRGFALSRLQLRDGDSDDVDGDSYGSIPYSLPVHNSAPRELFRLTETVEALTERVLAEESMLFADGLPHRVPRNAPGWPFDAKSWQFAADSRQRQHLRANMIDALDTDAPLLGPRVFPVDVPSLERLEVAAEVLLLWLSALTDGIVSAPLWARVDSALAGVLGARLGNEDDKATVLDALANAPNHNIAFVFLASMLAKVAAELAPIKRDDADGARGRGRAVSQPRVRSLSFRRRGATGSGSGRGIGEAIARRNAVQRRYSEIFGPIVCRASMPARERERKALEDRMRAVVEMFVHRTDSDE